jgi:hypothetical protein
VESPWLVCRYLTTDIGDFFQLGNTLRICFVPGHFFGQVRMPFCKHDHCVTGYIHRCELLKAVGRLGIVQVIQ